MYEFICPSRDTYSDKLMIGLRSAASSSSTHSAALHTSAVRYSQTGRLTAAQRSKKRKSKEIAASEGRPHVVLGHRPGDEAKWSNCDLAKVIITEEDIQAAPIPSPTANVHAGVDTPTYFNYGVGSREKELLFYTLPPLASERSVMSQKKAGVVQLSQIDMSKVEEADVREQRKATTFARLVDLRNANARGIAFENRRRIIAAFSSPENPEDPGRPEVQGAFSMLFTFTISEPLFLSGSHDVADTQHLDTSEEVQERCHEPSESAHPRASTSEDSSLPEEEGRWTI